MSIRAALRNPAVGVAVAVVILVAAGGIYFLLSRPATAPAPSQQWFLDLGSDQLFPVVIKEIPPVSAPSGKKGADGSDGGVKVHVMGCGSCAAADQFRAYLETYPAEARQTILALENRRPGEPPPQGVEGSPALAARRMRDDQRLVARPDLSGGWVKGDSSEGREIATASSARCEGKGTVRECYP